MSQETSREANDLPMFYSKPEAINLERHAGKALTIADNYSFASTTIIVPLMAAEMPAAMRSYPIVFSGPDFMPLAMVGFKDNENLFIESDGKWAEPHYVPAYVRRYPFILAGDEHAERLTLCVETDRLVDAAGSQAQNAKPLFEKGENSEIISNALKFCEEYQGMYLKTKKIMKVIADAGLLVERGSKITLNDGSNFNVNGFHLIDEAKLQDMSDKDFLALRKADALATIYCHLASMNSWTSLLHQANLKT